jgi:hypothetical protein
MNSRRESAVGSDAMIGPEHERQRLEAGVAAAARSLDGRAFEFEAPVDRPVAG